MGVWHLDGQASSSRSNEYVAQFKIKLIKVIVGNYLILITTNGIVGSNTLQIISL